MWDPPGPGLEPMPLALAGRFLTTVPPGKPCKVSLTFQSIIVCASHKMEKICNLIISHPSIPYALVIMCITSTYVTNRQQGGDTVLF